MTQQAPNEARSELPGEIRLPLGEALTIAEGYDIASAQRTQLVVLAGAVKSGKTTLISSLFHCFQCGPMSGYLFAGSKTLIGLDRRCHDARTSSNRARQTMERTKSGEERTLIHLRLCPAVNLDHAIDLLLTDLSGEQFRYAKDSVEECRTVPLLKRADHFVLLIDGEKISKATTRQRAKNEAQMLLRCCLDAEQLGPRSLVDVITTKWDLVSGSEAAPDTERFVEVMQESILKKYSGRVGRLRFFKIAARPDTPTLGLGFGLEKVLPSWVDETPDTVLPRAPFVADATPHCEYDRFGQQRVL